MEGTRTTEELKEQSKRPLFVRQKRTRPKVKKPKRKKRRKVRTATPLEQEVILCKRLHARHRKRTKINLAKLIKRLHVQPKYKVYGTCPKVAHSITGKGKAKRKRSSASVHKRSTGQIRFSLFKLSLLQTCILRLNADQSNFQVNSAHFRVFHIK